MNTPQIDSSLLWSTFVSHFRANIEKASTIHLSDAWAESAKRTKFYRDVALQGVARDMGYQFGKELFTVDYVMWKKGERHDVPIIFIESENDAFTATHEIKKLSCITAPLRVLITVIEWDDSPGIWVGGGQRAKLLAEWQSIIRSYNSVWGRSGVIGLLVGEWRQDGLLRFYANSFDANGSFVAKDEIILERSMKLCPPKNLAEQGARANAGTCHASCDGVGFRNETTEWES
jgi:hypothetical protein